MAKSLCLFLGICTAFAGCQTAPLSRETLENPIPHEGQKVSLPTYVIEPPDVLLIDAISIVPKPPYHIGPTDILIINASDLFPINPIPGVPEPEPIAGIYPVSPEGRVILGATYGEVEVAGMTLQEAETAIVNHLKTIVKNPKVKVGLYQYRAMEQIRGEHLVGQDGTINLGLYGTVPVTGLTIAQAKAAIEAHLSQYLQKPEISLQIYGYNSKVYYVIIDGAGYGQQVYRLPLEGSETVLDALSHVNGVPPQGSLKKIWLARPVPQDAGCDQVLAVNWPDITERGQTATNYQVLPGDRIYVQSDPILKTGNILAKILGPVEQVFGVTLLGDETVRIIKSSSGTGILGGF